MVVLLEGSPISTDELWSSLRMTMRFLTMSDHEALLPKIALFVQAASSSKSIGGYNLLPFRNYGGHCVLGDLQSCRNVSASTQSCL